MRTDTPAPDQQAQNGPSARKKREYVTIFKSDRPFQVHVRTVDNALMYRWQRIVRSGLIKHLTGVELRVLHCYDECANFLHWEETGELEAWPSIPTVARRCADAPGNVKRARRRLLRLGLLRRKSKGGAGRGDSSHFLLSLPDSAETDSETYLSPGDHARREADWMAKGARQRAGKGRASAPGRGALARPKEARRRAPLDPSHVDDRAGAGARDNNKRSHESLSNNGQQATVAGCEEGDYELLLAAGFKRKAAAAIVATPGLTVERVAKCIAAARQRADLENPLGWIRDRLVNGWDVDDAGDTELDREDLQRRKELAATVSVSDQAVLTKLDDVEWESIKRAALATFKGDSRGPYFARAQRHDLADPNKWSDLRGTMASIARARARQ